MTSKSRRSGADLQRRLAAKIQDSGRVADLNPQAVSQHFAQQSASDCVSLFAALVQNQTLHLARDLHVRQTSATHERAAGAKNETGLLRIAPLHLKIGYIMRLPLGSSYFRVRGSYRGQGGRHE